MVNDKNDPEEAAFNAYMEAVGANGEATTDEKRKVYYQTRYQAIRAAYAELLLQKEEHEGYKSELRERSLAKLTPIFRENYLARVRIVVELRKLGEKVDDPFVPLSKT